MIAIDSPEDTTCRRTSGLNGLSFTESDGLRIDLRWGIQVSFSVAESCGVQCVVGTYDIAHYSTNS